MECEKSGRECAFAVAFGGLHYGPEERYLK